MSEASCKEEECIRQLAIKIAGLESAVARLVSGEASLDAKERKALVSQAANFASNIDSWSRRIVASIPFSGDD